jgi:hemoglobin
MNPLTGATLYAWLGGYDSIAAVAENLLPRLMLDSQRSRSWTHRAMGVICWEQQLLIDFLCASAGGQLYYTDREIETPHKEMGVTPNRFLSPLFS